MLGGPAATLLAPTVPASYNHTVWHSPIESANRTTSFESRLETQEECR
jgi:hypothetical protein